MKSAAVAAVLAAAAACSKSSGTTTPPVDTCTGATVTVATNQVATVPAASAPCVSLPADGSTYLVSPNMASENGPATPVGIEVGSGPPAAADIMPQVTGDVVGMMPSLNAGPRGLREQFDFMLRARERTFTPAMRRPPVAMAITKSPPYHIGDTATFHVLSSLTGSSYKLDTALVSYIGNHIIIYLSIRAPAGGFTPSDLSALGTTFDTDLYGIDTLAFGAPSDIDGNGHVFVLLSPVVNSITPASQCATQGYISGYFDGTDLVNLPNSNSSEVFYSIVPDPSGTVSCTHATATVGSRMLGTFIHEFQHMISFNQHYLARGSQQEVTWLNEGMSHIAEELGSKFYEVLCPGPRCLKTDPTQLFPDSSQGFIGGDLGNFYSYLQGTDTVSATIFSNGGTLTERGAAWLFLRWLGDLKGETIYRKIDQTSLVGVPNIEAQAAESFPSLFGDWSLALYADSLPGYARATAPTRDRYQSRNLRALAYREYSINPAYFPLPFPIQTRTLPLNGKVAATMFVGTMMHYKITMPSSGSEMRLHFAANGGGTLPAGYSAQISVFHCPSSAACQ
jgi:hypothetical protein